MGREILPGGSIFNKASSMPYSQVVLCLPSRCLWLIECLTSSGVGEKKSFFLGHGLENIVAERVTGWYCCEKDLKTNYAQISLLIFF